MIHCVHHVPGRMRVRSPRVKNNHRHAQALEQFLRGLDGVGEASASTVTGSVVVHYAVGETSGQAILDRLKTSGFLVAHPEPTPPVISLSKSVGQRALETVVEKLVERSAVALISALI
jgi:hypothetical protein